MSEELDHTLFSGEWYLIEVNPEPWTAPEVGIGRRNNKIVPTVYKNEQLRAYQEAVAETLKQDYPAARIHAGQVELDFFLWRQLPVYEGEGRKVQKHQADATNLQKALEDALQGILFTNDRNVMTIQTTIMEQSPTTEGRILIGIHDHLRPPTWVTGKMTSMLQTKVVPLSPKRELPPDDDLF